MLHAVATIPVRRDALDDAVDVLHELVDATRSEEGRVAYDGSVSHTGTWMATSRSTACRACDGPESVASRR